MVNPITLNSQTSVTLDAKVPLVIEQNEAKIAAPDEEIALITNQ